MQTFDDSALGAARATRPYHASKPVCLWMALTAGLGLAACAGPSAQVQVAAADASQPATAASDAAGQAAANESAATASQEAKPGSADAAASGTAPPSAASASDTASAPPPSTLPAEPAGASDSAPAASTTSAPSDATQTAAAPQPAPSSQAAAPGSPSATTTPSAPDATQTAAAPQPASSQTAASDSAPAASAPSAPDATQTAAPPQPAPSQTAAAGDVSPPGSGLATGRPYVVIRFTESSVDYEKALSEAVKRAVERKPNLAFDLVAVTPRAGTADELADLTEQAHAEAAAVMKSLSNLGIGPDRVSIMTWTGQPTDVNEIRLYIR